MSPFHLSTPIWVLLGSLFIYTAVQKFLLHRRRSQLAAQHGCLPAQRLVRGGDPVLGLTFLLETVRAARRCEFFALALARFRRLGPTYVHRRWLYETVSTIDGPNVRALLSDDFDAFEMPNIRVRALSTLFGHGIFVSDGERWHRSRALVRPVFNRRTVAAMLGRMERHFQLLLQHIPASSDPKSMYTGEKGKLTTDVDLAPLFYNLTLDVASEFLVGQSTGMLDLQGGGEAARGFVRDYLHCCTEAVRVIHLGPLSRLHSFMKGAAEALPARDRAWAYIDGYVDQVLELRKKEVAKEQESRRDMYEKAENGVANAGGKSTRQGDQDNDGEDETKDLNFLQQLARETDDRVLLRDQILSMLLASRDTTAGLMSNLFFMLARHPDAYAKLRAEVVGVAGDELPTEAQLKNMTYLRWCINESLRLHPTIPANTRQAARDVVLPMGGGPDGQSPLLVNKGTNVLMNLYSMHRREDVFGPDPEAFRPERWDGGLRPGWAYAPFSGGPRICLGQQFALTEASYTIARMAQTFETVKSTDPRPFTEYYTIALFSKNGTQVSLKHAAK